MNLSAKERKSCALFANGGSIILSCCLVHLKNTQGHISPPHRRLFRLFLALVLREVHGSADAGSMLIKLARGDILVLEVTQELLLALNLYVRLPLLLRLVPANSDVL